MGVRRMCHGQQGPDDEAMVIYLGSRSYARTVTRDWRCGNGGQLIAILRQAARSQWYNQLYELLRGMESKRHNKAVRLQLVFVQYVVRCQCAVRVKPKYKVP